MSTLVTVPASGHPLLDALRNLRRQVYGRPYDILPAIAEFDSHVVNLPLEVLSDLPSCMDVLSAEDEGDRLANVTLAAATEMLQMLFRLPVIEAHEGDVETMPVFVFPPGLDEREAIASSPGPFRRRMLCPGPVMPQATARARRLFNW